MLYNKKKSNLEKQLIDIRKNYHQNYVKLNSNACEATATDHKNNLKPSARDNQTNQIKTNSGKSSNKFNVVVWYGLNVIQFSHWLLWHD